MRAPLSELELLLLRYQSRGLEGYRERLRQEPCSYCGGRARRASSRTLDHIVPAIEGGTDALHNLTPACKGCNMRKGDLSVLRFLVKRGGCGILDKTARRA